ncbi:conjugal transfer protein TraG N-terminal domain-containing protein [uncultured Thiodictyon sp.]|uniref:conjugal transfer protein TraG N-terminal domain-containing protein n=1 Tax=uncultured Thiodictyon sp. TaxID=1846217 RepID=UPI0025CE0DA9|nr:conjugal transfer protein TraG N-terminal domain-containing protein [uncultured Thiodictyon sp.]
MYTIYSIGDAAFLTAVLNAVAMLSGSGDMKQLAGVGFLFGIVLVMFQGIIQARPPQMQNVLVAWVIYAAMFGPTTKVMIEDNYMAECVLYEVDIDQRSLDDLMRNPSWTTLGPQTTMNVPTTQVWLGGAPQTLPCNEAWPKLQTYIATQFTPALRKSLAATLSLRSSAAVDAKVSSALTAIGANQTDAQNYMVMAAMTPYLAKGRAQALREIQHWNEAVMVEQAAQQRNTQWAGEEKMFKRNVRPLLSFLEAVLYAVSPLMVFAIGLGPLGFGLVGRYLLFALWIQLWQPLLAIVNLFLMMTIQGKLSALQDAALGNLVFPSFYALAKADALMIDYLGTGGMLAASVPAIALMLLYGSAITATSLAGRLQGGDHLNEKVVSPDVVAPAAALSMQALQDHGAVRGTAAPGAENVSWTANVGQDTQRELKSSQQASARASVGFGNALGSAASATASRSGESFDSHASGWNYEGSKSRTDQALMQTAESLSKQYSESGLSTNSIASVMAGSIGAGGKAVAKADIAARLSSEYGVKSDVADRMAADISTTMTSDQSFQTRLSEGLKLDSQSGTKNVFTSGLNTDESTRLTRSADDVLSASRSLDRAESMSERFGTLGSFNGVHTGAALAEPQNHAYMERMQRQIDRFGLGGDQQREEQRLLRGGATADPEQARGMAGMGLLLGYTDGDRVHRMTADERTAAKEAGMEILGGAFNVQTPQGINPGRNADLDGSAPTFGRARAAVDGAELHDVRPNAAGLQDQLAEHRAGVEHNGGLGAVDQFVAQGHQRLADFRANGQTALRGGKGANLGATITQHAMLPRPAAQLAQNHVGGLAIQVAEELALTDAGVSGLARESVAGLKAFGTSLADGQGLSGSIAAGKAAAGSEPGWSGARESMVNARMDQVSHYGLTATQTALYREATGALLADVPSAAQQTARQAVINEAGPALGGHVAELIERSASSRDDSDLRLIGAFNEQTQGAVGGFAQKKTEPPVGGGPSTLLSSPIGAAGGGTETSGFGMRVHPITGHAAFHAGEDLAAPVGTPLVSVADGVVTFAGSRGEYGNLVEVTHPGGLVTRYGHTSEMFVTPGQAVAAGQRIAAVGSTGRATGPHVHFETRMDGRAVDPTTVLGRPVPAHIPGPVGGVAQAGRAGDQPRPLEAPAELRDVFREIEQQHALPAGMLTAVASVESQFRANAVSGAGAQGMFQITPDTAKTFGVSNPFDPREAAVGAAKKLASDYQKFGNWNYAVMAYNAGTQRIEDYLAGQGKPLKQETIDYLPKTVEAFRRVNGHA